ncbi:hypothetical protein [Halobacillus karajensis]|uniref:hypothetical protein n=1 Tax=Halobacillus karajensis TaxID=195088 RepID=UPI000B2E3793|nr:hypothetical protein [Halobacillus karajensis]
MKNFYVIGFSMGAPIEATKYANKELYPLILAGPAAPSFTQRNGYPHGMKKEELNGLIEQLQHDRLAS